MGGAVDLLVEADAEAASARAASLLVAAVRAGRAIALSGGSTPRRAYELAAELERDWGRTTVWLADERCVPPGDPLANATLVVEAIVDRVDVPPRFHPVATHVGAEGAAARYDALLRREGLPALVLLGVGSDGHTASLFPGSPALDVRDALAVDTEAGLEPLVPRVTLTLPAIASAEQVVFLVTGQEKAGVARLAFAARPSHVIPASLARSAAGATLAVLDRAAASLL
jgi:6-phosphogluconolactonase